MRKCRRVRIPAIVYILLALALWLAWLVADGTIIVRVTLP
jgi:hypothetical protein